MTIIPEFCSFLLELTPVAHLALFDSPQECHQHLDEIPLPALCHGPKRCKNGDCREEQWDLSTWDCVTAQHGTAQGPPKLNRKTKLQVICHCQPPHPSTLLFLFIEDKDKSALEEEWFDL